MSWMVRRYRATDNGDPLCSYCQLGTEWLRVVPCDSGGYSYKLDACYSHYKWILETIGKQRDEERIIAETMSDRCDRAHYEMEGYIEEAYDLEVYVQERRRYIKWITDFRKALKLALEDIRNKQGEIDNMHRLTFTRSVRHERIVNGLVLLARSILISFDPPPAKLTGKRKVNLP
jgi:hypothetical protein